MIRSRLASFAPLSRAHIEAIHGSFQPLGKKQLHTVSGLIDHSREAVIFRSIPLSKHVVGGLPPFWRSAYANSNPDVARATHVLVQIAKTVVSAVSPTHLDANRTKRKVQLVVHNDEVVDLPLEIAHH